jgi:hypothetical protein
MSTDPGEDFFAKNRDKIRLFVKASVGVEQEMQSFPRHGRGFDWSKKAK